MPPGYAERWDPMKCPAIAAAQDEIVAMIMEMTVSSPVRPLTRRAARLAALVAAKAPVASWPAAFAMGESLFRMFMAMEKSEAKLPRDVGDMTAFKRQVAAQMMCELKAVMSPEEQEALAKLVTEGGRRIMAARDAAARGAQGSQGART
jgi:hypothetical protein